MDFYRKILIQYKIKLNVETLDKSKHFLDYKQLTALYSINNNQSFTHFYNDYSHLIEKRAYSAYR